MKIPKVIHYCWFGGNPLPETAVKCINSWKKYFPDYEIRERNYVKEAYKEKKWAFVRYYARFWILYNYGGLYFDTDVEVISNMDDIILNGPFIGFEKTNNTSKQLPVSAGLGMGAIPNMKILKELLDLYENEHFLLDNGKQNPKNVINYTTDVLLKYDLKNENKVQKLNEITVYPDDYFCPMNYFDGKITITNNTKSIHWYDSSWFSESDKKILIAERKIKNIFFYPIDIILCKLYRYIYRFFEYLFEGVLIKKIIKKIKKG